jgi:hypothetical protein
MFSKAILPHCAKPPDLDIAPPSLLRFYLNFCVNYLLPTTIDPNAVLNPLLKQNITVSNP